ncbi:MAG TPA: YbjN domain-containing protein [bacterium]|nr:YbjN domain-containing protein [bacterium]HNH34031.1 YbjN domain-containing protein [bacterium]
MAKKKSAPKKAAKKVVKKAVKKVAKAAPKKSTKKVAKKAAGVKKQKLTPDQLHAKVLGKVETYIKRIYGKSYEKHDDGRFLVFEGSTVVQTVLRPWHAGDIVVESFAYVVQDARLTDELMKFLLRENATLHFGSFGLSFDGTIIFGHSLAGANLDENEFSASIKSVARIADHYDNKIVEIAGGMTAREAMKKGIM